MQDYGFPWIPVGAELTPHASSTRHSETVGLSQETHELSQLQPGLPAQLQNSLTGRDHTSTARKKKVFFFPLKNCEEYFGSASISLPLCHHHRHHQEPSVHSSSSHLTRFLSLFVAFISHEVRGKMVGSCFKEKMIFPNFHARGKVPSWELPQSQDSWRSSRMRTQEKVLY